MASIINAKSTGVGGIDATGDASGVLQLQSSAVTVINLDATGSGPRITGDFSNATIANRVMFQTSTTNSNTQLEVLTSGTGNITGIIFGNSSDVANTSNFFVGTVGTTDHRLSGNTRGSGTSLPMTFYTGASERMRIDTSGNVGIGTSSPSYKLDVRGRTQIINSAAGTSTVATFCNDDTSGTSVVKAGFSNGGTIKASINAAVYGNDYMTFNVGSDTERMRIDSSGNVGIGTGSPATIFQLSQNGNTTALITATNSGTNSAGVTIENAGQRNWNIWADRSSDTFRIGNNTRATTNLTIGSNGAVSIGTSDTTSWGNGLSIYDRPTTGVKNFGTASVNFAARALGTAQGQLAGYSFWPTFVGTVDNGPRRAADIWSGFNAGNWGTQYLAFGVGNAANDAQNTTPERMRIDSAGNVGIGTSSPNAKLEVYGQRLRINAASDPGVEYANTATVKGYVFYDTAADVMTMRHASALGINVNASGNITTPSNAAFQVSGTTSPVSSGSKVPWTNAKFNRGNCFDTANSRFTAPVSGIYWMSVSLFITTTNSPARPSFRVNGSDYSVGFDAAQTVTNVTGAEITNILSLHMTLNAGDYVEVFARTGGGSLVFYQGHSWWSGNLIG